MAKTLHTTLRLKQMTKDKLEKSRDKFSYKSYDNLLSDMVKFFNENSLMPSQNLDKNIVKELTIIKEDFLKRDDSLRKWIGNIYHNKLHGIEEKLDKILIINEKNFTSEIVQEFKENEIESIKENTIDSSNKDNQEIELYKTVIEEKNNTIKGLLAISDKLVKSAKFQKATFGASKYIIELSEDEYNNFTKLLP